MIAATVAGVLILASQTTHAGMIIGPLTETEFLDSNDGAEYGPQTAIRAHDNSVSGPLTFLSGTQVLLYGAPGTADVDSLVFVLSFDPLALLGAGSIIFDFEDPDMDPVTLAFGDLPGDLTDDFFTSAESGFPEAPPGPGGIGGIGDGEVNSIKFPTALHGGVHVFLDGISEFVDGEFVASVRVSSPIDLRVDIFGVNDGGMIINNTPNSGAFGVFGIRGGSLNSPAPEPSSIILFGIGGASAFGYRWRRKRKLAA